MKNLHNYSANNYIENLPEDLIYNIYKIYYSQNCIREINNICFICYSKTNKHYGDESKNKCINCEKPVCKNCWDGYMMNYYRGFRVGLRKCPDCTIEIMKKLYL